MKNCKGNTDLIYEMAAANNQITTRKHKVFTSHWAVNYFVTAVCNILTIHLLLYMGP